MASQLTVEQFLDHLADGVPTPGGGSSAALVGAVAAGLVSMVGNLTLGREKFADVDEEARRLLEQSERIRAEMTRLIQADIDAFDEVSAAYRLPRSSEEEKAVRTAAIQNALLTATETPLAIGRAAADLLRLCEPMAKIGNPQAISDIGVGALSADAALQSAALNVEINLKSLKDRERVAAYVSERNRLLDGRSERLSRILATVRERL